MTAVLALLLALAAPAAATASAAEAGAPAPAVLRLAERLEEIAEPRAMLIAANYAGWEAAMRRTLALEPNFSKLEATYPGVGEAAIDVARPFGRAYCENFVTRAAAIRVRVYASELSEIELRQVIAFLESPAAQRVRKGMVANTNADTLVDQVARQAVEEGKVRVTMDQARQVDHDAAIRTIGEVSADDQAAFMRFTQSKAGMKYIAARAKSDPLLLDLINHQDPGDVARQQNAMRTAIMAFIARKKAH